MVYRLRKGQGSFENFFLRLTIIVAVYGFANPVSSQQEHVCLNSRIRAEVIQAEGESVDL